MLRRVLAVVIAQLMLADVAAAAEAVAMKTDWAGFRQQVAERKLTNRGVRIFLVSGTEFKTVLKRVQENGLVVALNGATKQWASSKEEAVVPREAVSSVRFTGRIGKGAMIGGLAGLAAGAAIAGAAAAGSGSGDCEGAACGSILLVIPLAAVGGWLIGRATQKPAPAFVLQQ